MFGELDHSAASRIQRGWVNDGVVQFCNIWSLQQIMIGFSFNIREDGCWKHWWRAQQGKLCHKVLIRVICKWRLWYLEGEIKGLYIFKNILQLDISFFLTLKNRLSPRRGQRKSPRFESGKPFPSQTLILPPWASLVPKGELFLQVTWLPPFGKWFGIRSWPFHDLSSWAVLLLRLSQE